MPYSKNILQEVVDLVQTEIMAIGSVVSINIAEHPQTKEFFIQIEVKSYHAVRPIRKVMEEYAIPEKVWDIKLVN